MPERDSGLFWHHKGTEYTQVLANISRKRSTKVYLEVGVGEGTNLAGITADLAVGVDPAFNVCKNVTSNKSRVVLFQMPSDVFFRDERALKVFESRPDMIFLDGMHLFEFLLRDFANSEAMSDRHTVIALHDCLPLTEAMAVRDIADSLRLSQATPYPGFWTGDVWKIIPVLRKYRPDLRITLIDAPPTGLVFVSQLDPSSTVLKDKYFEVVEYAFSMQEKEIANLFLQENIQSTSIFDNDFDYSRYMLA